MLPLSAGTIACLKPLALVYYVGRHGVPFNRAILVAIYQSLSRRAVRLPLTCVTSYSIDITAETVPTAPLSSP